MIVLHIQMHVCELKSELLNKGEMSQIDYKYRRFKIQTYTNYIQTIYIFHNCSWQYLTFKGATFIWDIGA